MLRSGNRYPRNQIDEEPDHADMVTLLSITKDKHLRVG
jgi:hypothetical protein